MLAQKCSCSGRLQLKLLVTFADADHSARGIKVDRQRRCFPLRVFAGGQYPVHIQSHGGIGIDQS